MRCHCASLLTPLLAPFSPLPSRCPPAGAFVSIRLDASRQHIPTLLDQNAAAVFDEVAARILGQLGYPTRHAWVHRLFPQGITLGREMIVAPVSFHIPTERVTRVMELFFEAAAEICLEREKLGIPRAMAAPVLLWDEVRVGSVHAAAGYDA